MRAVITYSRNGGPTFSLRAPSESNVMMHGICLHVRENMNVETVGRKFVGAQVTKAYQKKKENAVHLSPKSRKDRAEKTEPNVDRHQE